MGGKGDRRRRINEILRKNLIDNPFDAEVIECESSEFKLIKEDLLGKDALKANSTEFSALDTKPFEASEPVLIKKNSSNMDSEDFTKDEKNSTESETPKFSTGLKYIALQTPNQDLQSQSFFNPMNNSDRFEAELKKKIDEPKNSLIKLVEKNLNFSRENDAFLRPIHINSLPGHLHFALESINSYFGVCPNHLGVSLRVEVGDFEYETPIYNEDKTIKLSHYVKIPIHEIKPLTLRIILVQHTRSSLLFNGVKVKKCELKFELEKDFVDAYRNKLIEMTGHWCPYKSSSIFKNAKAFFFTPDVPAGTLRAFCSYLAVDEVPTINSPVPQSLFTLSKWLLVRKYAYELMFAGYVSIRGSSTDFNNVFWTRRYIKWYGYSLYILDEDTKNKVGSISIADADPDCTQLSKGILTFRTAISNVEIHCDSVEKMRGCATAVSILFPRMVSWI